MSSSREKKRKMKRSPSPESTPSPSLPYDLVVNCLALVPRLYYPNLSFVSKSFCSILTSHELYKTRTLLGRTETFLYVCLRFPDETNPRWFILCRKPNKTLTTKKKDSSFNLLAPVPMLNSPTVEWSNIVAVGSNLYAIGSASCSNVSFVDCRTHSWLEAPRMRLAHTNGRYDGKMYLPGSFEKPESLNCVEVYNTETQTWKTLSPEKQRIFKFENLEGKIYINLDVESHRERVALKPKDLTWEVVALDTDTDCVSVCVIDNITYVYIYAPSGKILWVDNNSMGQVWRNLEGLEGLPNFASYKSVKLANYGGKLVVLWDAASGLKWECLSHAFSGRCFISKHMHSLLEDWIKLTLSMKILLFVLSHRMCKDEALCTVLWVLLFKVRLYVHVL